MTRYGVYMGVSLLLSTLLGIFSLGGVTLLLGLIWLVDECRLRGTGFFLHPHRIVRILHFLWDFFVDITVSNVVLAWDVLTPTDLHRVSLIHVPVEDLTERELVFLSLRITLTPGTLVCDLTEDRRHLIVHAMFPLPEGMDRELRKPIDILKGLR